MFEELSTSIKATLFERAKKPFTGAFALSWLIINWRIIATLFFINEENLYGKNRIEYINENYIGWLYNFWLPIAVSIILILILPVLNIAALFIINKFKKFEFDKVLKKQPVDANLYAELLDKNYKL